MLRADGNRFPEAERIGFQRTRRAGATLAFVGDQDRRLTGAAHQVGESAIGRHCAIARIDQKEHNVGLRQGLSRLGLHPPRKGFAFGVFEACGIDHLERKIAEPALALAAVARHAGLIVDQRQPPPDQAVEQGRFADIRTADNGDGESHDGASLIRA